MMQYIFFGFLILLLISCGNTSSNNKIVLHAVEIKNDSNFELSEVETLIGDYRLVGSMLWPNQESNESSMDHLITVSEKNTVLLSVTFKLKDKVLNDKLEITSKLKPFLGKRIFIKFAINPEGNPIINNIQITEAKY